MRNRTLIGLLALAALLAAGVGFSGATFTAASGNPGNDFSTAESFGDLAATMDDPGANLAGTITLTASATDGGDGSTIVDVTVQRSPAGAGSWTDVCTDATAPYSCSFDTTAVADGLYDFRAVVTDTESASADSNVVGSRRVDNTAPSVALDDPTAPLTGSESFSATASDAGSGLDEVVFQVSPAGAGTWSDMCTDATSPYSCSYDTSLLADGSYDFRARATDLAGNASSSAASTSQLVDNTAPTVTTDDPGADLRATVSLTAAAADGAGSGVASVTVQRSPAGADTWTDVCTDATAPYSCSFDTTAVADGLYDLRALALDDVGLSAASAVVEDRRVDNTAPSASLTDPGTNLLGTVALEGDGADSGSGLASVTIQRSPAGADTWTDVCTDTTAPYSCDFDTTAVADGLYDFRAVASDNAGNAASSAVYGNRRVDNTAPSVSLDDPGSPVTGVKSFSGTAGDAGSGVASVAFQASPAGADTWSDVCTDATEPYACDYDSSLLADGSYDFRAVALDAAGNAGISAVAAGVVVDNGFPSASLVDPGAYLRATVVLSASADDGLGSGIASVTVQRSPAGADTWTDVCTDATAPYSCDFDTTAVADGLYDLRALATDNVAKTTVSATLADRRVDNTPPSVTLSDPGAYLRLTVSLSASADDGAGSGIASVTIQRSPAGAGTWTDVCTDATAPYSCSFDTTAVADGLYDLRAVASDNAGNTATATVANREVDNTPPSGVDVEAANGGGTAGRIDAGDVVTFTYSEALLPATLLAGWNGSSTAAVVRIDNSGSNDRLSVYDSTDTTLVALTAAGTPVALGGNYTNGGARFDATIVQTGSTITVTLGSLRSGGVNNPPVQGATISWTPSGTPTDPAGNACQTTVVPESTGNDKDF